MIKIFDTNDKDFSSAGNIIIEPIKCHEIKKKSLNGWYLDVEIPIKYAEYISKDKLCVVKTKSKLNPQAFRIGEEIQRSTRKIKFKAEHVMFDARDYALIDVRPTNQNGLNALNYINERTDEVSPFIMHSNVESINTAYFIRKNLLEAWATIEERWGGVFDADNWNISFLTSVGNDNGETVAYGKNTQGFDIYEDWSSVCTKLCPIGYDGLMLPEQFLISDVQYEKPYTRIIDFQTDLEGEAQTQENLLQELRTKAEEYLEKNKTPKVSYTIISNINNKLEIGDTIKVLHPYVNIFTEVLEYEYNLISKKLLSLTFGNYSRDVKTKCNNIKNTIEQINQIVSKQEVVINNQTNLINSLNKNGYVYIDENEILILDTIPKEKAKNVWRFGLGGIGFSSNGYEGPFEVAMTMDGQINANFITTGTLSVSRIEGLANFISETEKQISNIEIQQGNITSRVESVEGNIVNLQSQIDGSIQFWNGSEIPTVGNYPASEWTTEEEKNKHRADIYTVIEDIDGELKQGKSYRFDKVGDKWQWIELTDNELSAVQALAQSKAKVFVTTPKVPYNVGDLWLNNGKLLECQTAKDANGSYSANDWKEAVNYTDDTVANLAKALANTAQSTADSAVEGVTNITNTTGQAEGKSIHLTDSAEEPLVDISLHGETNQEGTPTPDTPSEIENVEGNLTVKLTGKNLWNNETFATNMSSNIYEKTENGFIFNRGEATGGRWVSQNINLKAGEAITFSYMKEGVDTALYLYEGAVYGTVIKNSIGTSLTYTADKDILIICTIIINSTCNSLIADNIQIEKSTVATEYEPHKEQTVYFPLAEGQKLMEGSYLAEDGVHNKRKQVVLDGTKNWSDKYYETYGFFNIDMPDKAYGKTNLICSHFKTSTDEIIYSDIVNGRTNNTNICFYPNSNITTTLTEWKTWLQSNPITVEYELVEEEIVPYTEEQQEAWDCIMALMTYKNVTNISSNAYAKITYMRDNGLDVYETKQNADKRYTETSQKIAEQKITTDAITNRVSETVTILNNDYLRAEQVNAEIDGTKEDIDILKQKQASTELTTEAFQIQLDTINNEGVNKVKTSMGYTFDDEGMKIDKENADTGTIVDEAGFRVLDKTGINEQNLLYAGYVKEGDTNYPDYIGQTIVATANLIVQNYLVVGSNSRFEDYENPVLGGEGTGVFEI